MLKNIISLCFYIYKRFKFEVIKLQILMIFNSILQILSIISFGPLILVLTKNEKIRKYQELYFNDFKGVDDWGHLHGARSIEEIFEASKFILSDKFDDEGMLTKKDMNSLYRELRKFEFINGRIKYCN